MQFCFSRFGMSVEFRTNWHKKVLVPSLCEAPRKESAINDGFELVVIRGVREDAREVLRVKGNLLALQNL